MFYLFGGKDTHYASGGANDFIKSFATLEAAETYANHYANMDYEIDYENDDDRRPTNLVWWQITDANLKIVKMSAVTPYYDDMGARTKIWPS